MNNENEILIMTNFGHMPDDIFGKLSIAPNSNAKLIWELWEKSPQMFTLAPEYEILKEENGVVTEARFLGISVISRGLENKPVDQLCKCYVCRHGRWLATGKGEEPKLSDE